MINRSKSKKAKKKKKRIFLNENNPVVCRYTGDPNNLFPVLSYQDEIWIPGKYAKERRVVTRSLIGKTGLFLTGFLPRVREYLDYKKIPYTFHPEKKRIQIPIKIKNPELKGITFLDFQKKAITTMIEAKRGVWEAPTGSGKTIMFFGLMSAIDTVSVVVVHTLALFRQTYEELCKYFPKEEIGRIGDGKKEIKKYNIAMVKTLSKLEEDYKNIFGLIIIDEVHHATILKGMYAQVLRRTFAPYRFGVTGTIPPQESKQLIMEGLIGRVLGRTSYEELTTTGVLAIPKLKLKLVPANKKYIALKGAYGKVYRKGIVKNRIRNQLIISTAKELMKEGRSVLILVERIMHGVELSDFAEKELPKNSFIFIHGETDDEAMTQIKQARRKWLKLHKKKEGILLDLGAKKEEIKKDLEKDKELLEVKEKAEEVKKKAEKETIDETRHRFEKKEVHCVIATRVWSEGINVKSIGAVINAVGGNSELRAIQNFGRGMRVDEGKTDVVLVDFIDTETHRWFEKHSMERICFYSDRGWI